MDISSADIANSIANDARRTLEDQAVLIGWLEERISILEAALNLQPVEHPELPSAVSRRRMLEYNHEYLNEKLGRG